MRRKDKKHCMTVMYNYSCEVHWSILALALEVIFSFLLSTFSQADIFCVIVLCMVRSYGYQKWTGYSGTHVPMFVSKLA